MLRGGDGRRGPGALPPRGSPSGGRWETTTRSFALRAKLALQRGPRAAPSGGAPRREGSIEVAVRSLGRSVWLEGASRRSVHHRAEAVRRGTAVARREAAAMSRRAGAVSREAGAVRREAGAV